MPTLGGPLNFNQLEGRNFRAHQLSTAPASPVTGQLYYDTGLNSLLWYNGTAWVSASGGTPPDATTSTKGVIQLAGDLAGTAAAPVVAPLAITDAKVAAANKDGAVGTPSMRTLGLGAAQAMPGNERLDQITAPSAPVSLNSQNLTNVATPVNPNDGSNKQYVDNTAQGLSAKNAVVAASNANIVLSGLTVVDGYTPTVGDRILVKGQTTPSQNGIYIVAAGAWSRAPDMAAWAQFPSAYTWVEQGGTNADTGWVCTNDPGGTLGTTNVTWVQFAGAGTVTVTAPLTKAGSNISLSVDGTTIDAAGAGASLEVKPGGVGATQLGAASVNLAGATVTGTLGLGNGGTGQTTAKAARETGLVACGYYSATGPPSSGTTITINQATHGLRSGQGIHVQVQDATSGAIEIPDVTVDGTGLVTVTYASTLAVNAKRVTLVG
jgi:hypothetical protein